MTTEERAAKDAAYREHKERERVELYRFLLKMQSEGTKLYYGWFKAMVFTSDPYDGVQEILNDILAPLMPSIELALVERLKGIVDAWDAEHGGEVSP